MIIDFHVHCYPDALAKKALSRIPKDKNIEPYFDATFDGLKQSMDEAGVDVSVLLNIASRPDTMFSANEWTIKCNADSRIFAFGSVHPDTNYKEELKRLKDNGIKGIKLHPHYQHFYVNDEKVFPMYEEIFKQGFCLIFHCGLDMMVKEPFCTPSLFVDLVNRFEGEKLIVAHLGGTGYTDDSERLLYGRDVYLDTSIAFKYLDADRRSALFSLHSPERILFGTDMPWANPKLAIADMKSSVSSQETLDKIMYGNAAKLLGLRL